MTTFWKPFVEYHLTFVIKGKYWGDVSQQYYSFMTTFWEPFVYLFIIIIKE